MNFDIINHHGLSQFFVNHPSILELFDKMLKKCEFGYFFIFWFSGTSQANKVVKMT